MPMTFHCGSCNATWIEDVEPTDCPRCGSRTIERREAAGPPAENRYAPPMARVSSAGPVSSTSFSVTYWLGFIGAALGYALLTVGAAMNGNNNRNNEADPLLVGSVLVIFAGAACLLASTVIACVKIYRGWDLIQPLRRADWNEANMTTPGLAVGLLFVPLFSLYWNFVSLHGLATKANKYMNMAKIDGRPMNEGMAQTYCILVICTAIPCVGILVAPVCLVMYYLFILDVDRMRNTIGLAGTGASIAEAV